MTARILGAAIVAGMTLMSAGAWAATVNYTATLDGKSEVRRVKLDSGEVMTRWHLPGSHFGEGIARRGIGCPICSVS